MSISESAQRERIAALVAEVKHPIEEEETSTVNVMKIAVFGSIAILALALSFAAVVLGIWIATAL